MIKKNILMLCLSIIGFFLIVPAVARAIITFKCDEPKSGGTAVAQIGNRCGVRGDNDLTINCNSPLTCSSNEFNICQTRVCLLATGGACNDNRECEGGSVCNIKSDSTTGICDTSPDDDTASSSDLRDTIRRILNVILGFLGIITVVMVIYGGFIWLTAAGNEDAVGKGRHTLLWAALGAILIGIAWTVSSYILSVAEKVG